MASIFETEGFKLDPSSPFYSTPEEQLAQKTAWDKYKGSDLTNFYAADPQLTEMQDRISQAMQREAAKPLATPTDPGVGAQAAAVNEMRLAGVDDPYSSDTNKGILNTLTSNINKNGYKNTVDNRGPVSQFFAGNPEFLPDNNTQGTPYLEAGGTGNNLEQINNDLFINSETGVDNTPAEQAQAVAAVEETLAADPNAYQTPVADTSLAPQSQTTDTSPVNPAATNTPNWYDGYGSGAEWLAANPQGTTNPQGTGNSTNSMDDFMKFMMMMNMMGGMGGGRGFGGSQYGYGGLNPGGVQSAYNPLEQLQGSWDWFNKSFGSGVQGGSTANVQ